MTPPNDLGTVRGKPGFMMPQSGEEGEPKRDSPSADEIFDKAAEHLLDAQVRTIDTLDARVATAFGVASTVLPLTIGLLNLQGGRLSLGTKALLIAALVLYLGLTVCCFGSYRQRRVSYRPNVEELAQFSQEYDGATLRRWVAEGRVQSIQQNRNLIDRKHRFAQLVFAALYAEAILLSLGALVTVL